MGMFRDPRIGEIRRNVSWDTRSTRNMRPPWFETRPRCICWGFLFPKLCPSHVVRGSANLSLRTVDSIAYATRYWLIADRYGSPTLAERKLRAHVLWTVTRFHDGGLPLTIYRWRFFSEGDDKTQPRRCDASDLGREQCGKNERCYANSSDQQALCECQRDFHLVNGECVRVTPTAVTVDPTTDLKTESKPDSGGTWLHRRRRNARTCEDERY